MKLRIDSPIITTGIKLSNLLILNLYWVIGCLPIITIGASTIAAFTVTLKMTEDREDPGMTVQFWSAYVRNLKHGIPLTLILAAAAYSVWIDWQLFEKLENNPIGFLILAMLVIFLLLLHYLYVFALEARYENRLLSNLANSRKICVRFFLRTLGLAGILVVQFLLFTQVAPFLTYIGIFCCPILMIYTVSQISMPIFRRLEADNTAHDGFSIGGRG